MGWMFVRRKAPKRIEEYRDEREGSEVLLKKWACLVLLLPEADREGYDTGACERRVVGDGDGTGLIR